MFIKYNLKIQMMYTIISKLKLQIIIKICFGFLSSIYDDLMIIRLALVLTLKS